MPFAIPFPEIDPALFTIAFGGVEFSLRWYALAYIAGLVLGWRLMVWLMRRDRLWPEGKAPMTPAQPEELLTWMVLGVVLGGRLGFALFYAPAYYLSNPLEILKVWEGGMAFHGGFLGVILGVIFYCRVKRLPVMQVGDAVALATPTGLLFGRLANFVNNELWGRPTGSEWGMVFPGLPEILLVGGENLPRHPSQLYEAALEGALLFAVMWWLALARGWLKRPGALIGVFFIGYGLTRSTAEFFRQGNLEFVTPENPHGLTIRYGEGLESWGFTMGQILSLPMIAIGILWLVWALTRRRVPARGDGGA